MTLLYSYSLDTLCTISNINISDIIFIFVPAEAYQPYLCTKVPGSNNYINAVFVRVSQIIH